MTPEQLAESMKSDLRELVAKGEVPETVRGFGELHDYIDGNCLGECPRWLSGVPDYAYPLAIEAIDKAQGLVDAWIKGGGLKAALVTA